MTKMKNNKVKLKNKNKSMLAPFVVVFAIIGVLGIVVTFAAPNTTGWVYNSSEQGYNSPPTDATFSYEKIKGKTFLLLDSTSREAFTGPNTPSLADYMSTRTGKKVDVCINGLSSSPNNSLSIAISAYGGSIGYNLLGQKSFSSKLNEQCFEYTLPGLVEYDQPTVGLKAISGTFKIEKVTVTEQAGTSVSSGDSTLFTTSANDQSASNNLFGEYVRSKGSKYWQTSGPTISGTNWQSLPSFPGVPDGDYEVCYYFSTNKPADLKINVAAAGGNKGGTLAEFNISGYSSTSRDQKLCRNFSEGTDISVSDGFSIYHNLQIQNDATLQIVKSTVTKL